MKNESPTPVILQEHGVLWNWKLYSFKYSSYSLGFILLTWNNPGKLPRLGLELSNYKHLIILSIADDFDSYANYILIVWALPSGLYDM